MCEHKTITAEEKKLFLTQNMQFWFVPNEAVSYEIIPYTTGQCKQVCFWQNGTDFSTIIKILIISQKWSVATVSLLDEIKQNYPSN